MQQDSNKSVTTLMVIRTLEGGDAKSAEKQLALIVESSEGEKKLREVVSGLDGGHIVALTDAIHADMTHPSLAAHLVSPNQLIEMLGHIGATYGDFPQAATFADFQPVLERVFHSVGQVVLTTKQDHERTSVLIAAIVDSYVGEDLFIAFAAGSPDLEEVLKNPLGYGHNEDWRAMLALLYDHHPEAFSRVKEHALKLINDELEEDRLDTLVDSVKGDRVFNLEKHALRILKKLRKRALRNIGGQKGGNEKTSQVTEAVDPFHSI